MFTSVSKHFVPWARFFYASGPTERHPTDGTQTRSNDADDGAPRGVAGCKDDVSRRVPGPGKARPGDDSFFAIAMDAAASRRRPLPRYVTNRALFAAAVTYEAAIYAGCMVGAALMLPAALVGVDAGRPQRYAQKRWDALHGLRLIAVARPDLSPGRLAAFEALPAAEQRSIARALGARATPFESVDAALDVLMDLGAELRLPLCRTLRAFFGTPEAANASSALCLDTLRALPAELLVPVLLWGQSAPPAALAWLVRSHGTVFAGKAAWISQSPVTYTALQSACGDWAWDMAIDAVLQAHGAPDVATMLAVRQAMDGVEQHAWFTDAVVYAAGTTPQARDDFYAFLPARQPLLVPMILDVCVQERPAFCGGMVRLMHEFRGTYGFGEPRLFSEMAVRPRLLRAVSCDLQARPDESYRQMAHWLDVPTHTEAAVDRALEMRDAGLPVSLVARRVAAYAAMPETARTALLERIGTLRNHQDWGPGDIYTTALAVTDTARIARLAIGCRVSREAANLIVALPAQAWELAKKYPDDLGCADWLRWIATLQPATLAALTTSEGVQLIDARISATYKPTLFAPLLRRCDVAELEAAAPSLWWLKRMANAVSVKASLFQLYKSLGHLTPAQQCDVMTVVARSSHAAESITGIAAALILLPEDAAVSNAPFGNVFADFCAGLSRYHREARADLERMLDVFAPMFSTWGLDDRRALLRVLTPETYGGWMTRAHLSARVSRLTDNRAPVVSQALAWCRVLPGEMPAAPIGDAWDRDRAMGARMAALSTQVPPRKTDASCLAWAASARGADALAAALAAWAGDMPDHERYFLLQLGSVDDRFLAARLYGGVGPAVSAFACAWGGRGPLPHGLRTWVLQNFAVPADELDARRDPVTTLRLADADGVSRLFALCDTLHLPPALDRALRVSALDVLDPPREVTQVLQSGCVSYGCESPASEAHAYLAGCSCGQTLCDGCAKDALAAAPDIQTCRASPDCGAPLTREYLERLGHSETAAVDRRLRHYSEKLQRLPDFVFDVSCGDTLRGMRRPEPVFGPDAIVPLPERLDVEAVSLLIDGLGRSANAEGTLVERECYHCGVPVQKDEACLHMAPQANHMHGHWDFVNGPYDGRTRWAHDGLPAQAYIPLAPGPLARAHFYDGLPPGVMTEQTRRRVERRRDAWRLALDGRRRGG